MKTIITCIIMAAMITGCASDVNVAKTDQLQLSIQPELLQPIDPMITIKQFNQQNTKQEQLTD